MGMKKEGERSRQLSQRWFPLKKAPQVSRLRKMSNPPLRFLACVIAVTTTLSCTSTIPDAAQLDQYQALLRQRAEPEFAEIKRLRDSGQITQATYEAYEKQLNQRILHEADSLAWSRHNMAESQRKALGIPTPDKPVANTPPIPGINSGGSLYRPATQQFNSQAGTAVNQTSASLLPRTSQFYTHPAPQYPGTGGVGVDPYYDGGGY